MAADNYETFHGGNITCPTLPIPSNASVQKLTRDVGPQAVVRLARRLGIGSELNPVLARARNLRGAPMELTGAYAAYANGGTGVMPYVVLRVQPNWTRDLLAPEFRTRA